MGWIWGSSDDKDQPKTANPLEKLDPSLRDFLQKESPVKYGPAEPTSTQAESEASNNARPNTDQGAFPQHQNQFNAASSTAAEPSSPSVPSQSLFSDGRYAHIWKTYTPLSDVENRNKSDQDKILDVLEGYKHRKAEIGRAALENCALEQWAVNDCFRTGGWTSRLTMCRSENKELERCYTMQAKFLKALGYLSTYDRPPEVDEQIQMHADKLYHQMLDQEAAIERAKAENLPPPVFAPLLPSSQASPSATTASPPKPRAKIDQLSYDAQAQLTKRLQGLTDKERDIEEKAIAAEIVAGEQLADRLTDVYKEQDKARAERKERGQQTITDQIRGIFGR